MGQAQRAESSKWQIREMSTHSEVNAMQQSCNQLLSATQQYIAEIVNTNISPAYGQVCSLCHKLNHFLRVCRSRQIGSQQRNSQANTQNNSRTNWNMYEMEHSDTPPNFSTRESQDLFIEPLQSMGLRNKWHGLLI